MNKKRIDITIPHELYLKYRHKLSFSGLLTELLENMATIDEFKGDMMISNRINGIVYSVSIKDISNYINYIREVNKK